MPIIVEGQSGGLSHPLPKGYNRPRWESPTPQKVLALLREGPASREDIARAIWGDEWLWPLTWENAVRVHINWLREKYAIKTRKYYTLED